MSKSCLQRQNQQKQNKIKIEPQSSHFPVHLVSQEAKKRILISTAALPAQNECKFLMKQMHIAGKAYMLRVNRHLPQRVSFLSMSIDHMLHLPPAHRMKKKMRVYLQGLVMISYIRLTHWCNDFAKIPHSEKSRGHACWDGLSPSSPFKGMVFGGRGGI